MATELQDGCLTQELRSSAGDNPPPSKPTGTIHGPVHHCRITINLLHSTKMPRCRKNPQQPQKLLRYFTTAPRGLQQNGGGVWEQRPEYRATEHNSSCGILSTSFSTPKPHNESSSGTSSPSTRS